MDMIEKVARALYCAHPRNKPWELLRPEFQAQYKKQARAAIEAMQTPTAKMIEWGSTERTKSGGDDDVPHIFEAMIKAALEE
jgi:hypothetical protein